MTGQQHLAIGTGLGSAAAVGLATNLPGGMAGPPPLVAGGLLLLGAMLGALLPDLDTDHSLLEAAPWRGLRRARRRGWLVWLLAAPVLLLLGLLLGLLNLIVMLLATHRGVTHSLTALLLVAAAAWLALGWLLGPAPALGLAFGYASHLAADALTPMGVPLAAPWSWRRCYLLPRRLRFGGGSRRAGIVASLTLLGGVGLAGLWLWRALPFVGS